MPRQSRSPPTQHSYRVLAFVRTSVTLEAAPKFGTVIVQLAPAGTAGIFVTTPPGPVTAALAREVTGLPGRLSVNVSVEPGATPDGVKS